MNLAVIPARGGSKRIPGKNIKQFLGRPVIAYSINAARESKVFDRIIVSTDSTEIAEVARQYGADTPFLRPPELSDDHSPTIPVVRHAIDWVCEHHQQVDSVCCIYATAPLVQAECIRRGLEILRDTKNEFAISVTRFGFPIFRALKLENGGMQLFWPEHNMTRSQDLPDAYHDAGQFYWGTPDAYRRHDGFFLARVAPVILPRYLVQDIDTAEDWTRAEHMFRAINGT